jgi:hypothetical protein
LIVEDDPNIRKLVQVNLVKRGYTVSEAEDSHQAISRFQAETVDLNCWIWCCPAFPGGCVHLDPGAFGRAHHCLERRLEEDLKVAARRHG